MALDLFGPNRAPEAPGRLIRERRGIGNRRPVLRNVSRSPRRDLPVLVIVKFRTRFREALGDLGSSLRVEESAVADY